MFSEKQAIAYMELASVLILFSATRQQDNEIKKINWAIPEKIQTGRLRILNLQGHQRSSMWDFQALIKNKVEFPRVTKKK